jgi:hypothetical protein
VATLLLLAMLCLSTGAFHGPLPYGD